MSDYDLWLDDEDECEGAPDPANDEPALAAAATWTRARAFWTTNSGSTDRAPSAARAKTTTSILRSAA